jgi:hypothetical protein
MKELENLVGENRLIPLPRIDCPSPVVWDELERRREYAGTALDLLLQDSKYKVQEVKPEFDERIIGSFNTSFYLIRDKKGNIVGEVKYSSGKVPFTVKSYDKQFDERAKKIEKVLNEYDRPVYRMLDDTARLPVESIDEVRKLPLGKYIEAHKHANQPIYN